MATLPLWAVASAASAQLSPGISGFSGAPTTATEDEYWFFVRELGRCLAQTKREKSIALLEAPIDSPAEKRAFDALIKRHGANKCMSNMRSATLVRAQVRGSVAEGLYEANPRPAPMDSEAAVLPAETVIRSLHDFANCYVAKNPSPARSLLSDTDLGTQRENERVREMAAGFGPCLPQGRQVRIVPMDVRMALAEALYRTTVSRPAATQGSN